MEWHFSFPLMNSYKKTEAAIFPMQTMLSFPFSHINWYLNTNNTTYIVVNFVFFHYAVESMTDNLFTFFALTVMTLYDS